LGPSLFHFWPPHLQLCCNLFISVIGRFWVNGCRLVTSSHLVSSNLWQFLRLSLLLTILTSWRGFCSTSLSLSFICLILHCDSFGLWIFGKKTTEEKYFSLHHIRRVWHQNNLRTVMSNPITGLRWCLLGFKVLWK
jgi:hypothetical protein